MFGEGGDDAETKGYEHGGLGVFRLSDRFAAFLIFWVCIFLDPYEKRIVWWSVLGFPCFRKVPFLVSGQLPTCSP